MRQSTLSPPMRKPQQRGQDVQTKAPPMGGIDSISPRALMPEANAVILDNFIASESGLAMREGWWTYATNVGAAAGAGPGKSIETILCYAAPPDNALDSPLAQSELFAATDGGIYLVEGGGDMRAHAPVQALSGSLGAGHLNFVQFTTEGDTYLVVCSETDGAYLYDGATWIKFTSAAGTGPGHVTGSDPTKWVQVCVYKKRLMFLERASGRAWILDTGLVGGAAAEFDFGPMLRHGGAVLALVNWTQSAGEGINDRLLVLGTAGDLIVYQGDDPTSVDAFSNVGIWYIGQPPIGRRSFTTAGGEVYALTAYGCIVAGKVVEGGLDNILTSNADMLRQLRLINPLLATEFKTKMYTPGWEIVSIPSKSLMMITRPRTSDSDDYSYAFQMHNLAWSRLLSMPARTFGLRLDEVYSGTDDGRVLRVLDGFSDARVLDGSGADHIRAQVTPAFNYYGAPEQIKQALMVKPTFLSEGPVDYIVRVDVDFYVPPAKLTPVETLPRGARWDQGIWNQSYWPAGLQAHAEWRAVEAVGTAFATTLFVSAQSRCVLSAITTAFRAGGTL